ncbi:MAG: hypothetical protein AAGF67_09875 [Verrucomicrobiota bacterium]
MYRYDEEAEFPNWWDALDAPAERLDPGEKAGPGDDEEIVHRAEVSEQAERRSGVILSTGDSLEVDFRGEFGAEKSGQVSESSEVEYSARLNRGYDREVIENVWGFAETVPGNDPDLWRKDEWGNWIRRIDYGRRESEFGWEIFDPGIGRHSQGVYAMRPMQWTRFLEQFEVFG